MVCSGFKPRAAEQQTQTKPRRLWRSPFCEMYLKIGPFAASFSLFSSFSIQQIVQIHFSNDCTRTADPWCRKQPLYQFATTTSVKVFLRQSSSRFVFVISANVGQRIPVVQQLDIFGRARSLRPQLCPLVLHEREQMLPKRVQHKGLLGLLVPSKCPFKKFPILAKAVAKLCNLWENDI